MYKFIILCLLVSISVSTINKNNSSKFSDRKRIIGGGFVASITSIPYQAAIETYHNDRHSISFCGGSLITNKFVLTAAHCLYQSYIVLVGLGVRSLCNIRKSRSFMRSTKFLPHEDYTKGLIGPYDIGLIELPQSVKLDSYIDTIKLPSKANAHESYVGYKAKVSGWGYNERFRFPNTLKFLYTVIVKAADCTFPINERYLICAFGENDGRVCNGDSGGALVIRDSDNTLTQIGIVSYGKHNCEENYPAVYTRVDRYMDWIEQHSNYKFA